MSDAPFEIPEPWSWTTIGEVGEIHSGSTPSTEDEENFGGEISWLTPADLSDYDGKYIEKGRRSLTEKGLNSCSAVVLPKGSVLFSSRAPVGYTVIAANPIATNQGFKNLVPGERVSSDFVYHYLKGNKALAESYASGTTFKELSATRFARIPIPIPPLSEQRRIVAKIEELFSELDAGVAALEKAQKQLQRYRQSVLQAAVEGRLTEAWRKQHDVEPADKLLERILEERRRQWETDYRAKYEAKGKKPPRGWKSRYKEPEEPNTDDLPEIPEGWVWTSGDQVLRYVTSGSRGWSKYYADEGQLFVRVGDISNPDIEIDQSDIQCVDLPEDERGHRSLLKPDDLLISITADIGKVGIVPDDIEEAYINQHVALTRPSSPDTTKYLAYYIISPAGGRRQFLNMQRGATKAGLTLTDIKNLRAALPSEREMNQIVAEVERLLSVAEDASRTSEREHMRAERLRQSILKQAFSGKLVPNEEEATTVVARSANGVETPDAQIELPL